MDPQMRERLLELERRIIEQLIGELDPATWAGAGKTLGEMSREERGDRAWDKKNVGASLTILLSLRQFLGIREDVVDAGALDAMVEHARRIATERAAALGARFP